MQKCPILLEQVRVLEATTTKSTVSTKVSTNDTTTPMAATPSTTAPPTQAPTQTPASSTATLTTITQAPSNQTATSPTTTSTTQSDTTNGTQKPEPAITIGSNCSGHGNESSDNEWCGNGVDGQVVCFEGICTCSTGHFPINSTACLNETVLNTTEISIISTDVTSFTLSWENPAIQESQVNVTVVANNADCDVGQAKNATCAGLEPGCNYTVKVKVQSGTFEGFVLTSASLVPESPGQLNTTLCGVFEAPNVTLCWDPSEGCVDYYSVNVKQSGEPSEPLNLTVEVLGEKEVKLNWESPEHPNGMISAYTVDNGDNCGSDLPERIVVNQKDMNYTISGLDHYKNYSMWVTPFTAAGSGQISNTTQQTTETRPGPVGIVTIRDIGPTAINVTWTIPEINPGPTNYTAVANSTIPGQEHIARCEVEAPGTPLSLQVFNYTPPACDATKVKVTWTEPNLLDRHANITQYIVQTVHHNDRVFTYPVVNPQPFARNNSQFSWEQDNLEAERTYQWQLFAVGRNGKGFPANYTFSTGICAPPKMDSVLEKLEITSSSVIFNLDPYFFTNEKQGKIMAYGMVGGNGRDEVRTVNGDTVLSLGSWSKLQWKNQLIGGGKKDVLITLPEIADLDRSIPIATYSEALADLHRDTNLILSDQYEEIKRRAGQIEVRSGFEAANLEPNKPKNRWVNILPFDHSRVNLQQLDDDDPESDYINANYMPGFHHQREFIATQGPLPGTIDDFWRMVWEQNVMVIVMLTQCKEGNRVKCEMYWPDTVQEAKQYGDVVVNPTSITNMNKFNINIFDISHASDLTKTRKVLQFHYLDFMDFTAAVEVEHFIEFVRTVRGHVPHDMTSPMVIHCSAGVGRTGSYIAIDHLQEYLNSPKFSSDDHINIFDMVMEMREQRVNMVQTEAQYILIHDCFERMLEDKKKSLKTTESMEELYANQAY
ncbi:PTPRB-like protein, partial [Mya arenaria]